MAVQIENEIDNETLMNCVQDYSVIYDKMSKDYKIPLRKRNAWKEASTELGIDVEVAQKRYNNIRTTFSKYVRRMKCVKSGSGPGRRGSSQTVCGSLKIIWKHFHLEGAADRRKSSQIVANRRKSSQIVADRRRSSQIVADRLRQS